MEKFETGRDKPSRGKEHREQEEDFSSKRQGLGDQILEDNEIVEKKTLSAEELRRAREAVTAMFSEFDSESKLFSYKVDGYKIEGANTPYPDWTITFTRNGKKLEFKFLKVDDGKPDYVSMRFIDVKTRKTIYNAFVAFSPKRGAGVEKLIAKLAKMTTIFKKRNKELDEFATQ